MSKADEKLKELGYTTIFDNYTVRMIYGKIYNSEAENVCFEFIEKDKTLNLSSGNYNVRLIQAINEKIKELGWLER